MMDVRKRELTGVIVPQRTDGDLSSAAMAARDAAVSDPKEALGWFVLFGEQREWVFIPINRIFVACGMKTEQITFFFTSCSSSLYNCRNCSRCELSLASVVNAFPPPSCLVHRHCVEFIEGCVVDSECCIELPWSVQGESGERREKRKGEQRAGDGLYGCGWGSEVGNLIGGIERLVGGRGSRGRRRWLGQG